MRVALKQKIPSFFNNHRKFENDDDFILNQGMLNLEKQNHENLVEIYNSLPRSIAFYQVISDDNLIKIVNQLLGNTNKKRNLYINSNSVRMDIPGPNKFMYGWHQDYKK